MRINFTQRTMDAIKAPDKGNQLYFPTGDGYACGFGLRVTAAGAKSWVLNYTNAAGVQRRYTLGEYPGLSIKQAEAQASEWRGQIDRTKDPLDPLEVKRQAREQARQEHEQREAAPTVARLAELWQTRHARLHKRAPSQASDRSILNRQPTASLWGQEGRRC